MVDEREGDLIRDFLDNKIAYYTASLEGMSAERTDLIARLTNLEVEMAEAGKSLTVVKNLRAEEFARQRPTVSGPRVPAAQVPTIPRAAIKPTPQADAVEDSLHGVIAQDSATLVTLNGHALPDIQAREPRSDGLAWSESGPPAEERLAASTEENAAARSIPASDSIAVVGSPEGSPTWARRVAQVLLDSPHRTFSLAQLAALVIEDPPGSDAFAGQHGSMRTALGRMARDGFARRVKNGHFRATKRTEEVLSRRRPNN